MTSLTLIEADRAPAAARLEAAGVAFGHGTTNAFDEAAWLVLWRLGLPLDELDAVAERPLSRPTSAPRCDALVARAHRHAQARRLPDAAKPGCRACPSTSTSAPSCRAASSPNCWPTARIDPWLSRRTRARVLDLCTGNGSLAVLAAMA